MPQFQIISGNAALNAAMNAKAAAMGFTIVPEYVAPAAEYDGEAYFWAHEYRHSLRDCIPDQCRAVRDALIAARLPLDGESAQHEAIVDAIVPINTAMATDEQLVAALAKCQEHDPETGFMRNTLAVIGIRQELNKRKANRSA